jgi:Putative prokaryotic signal transducing protein
MKELLRTNNPVYLSFAEAVLKDAGIDCLIFDQNMSVMEGSIGALPRRLMVPDREFSRARQILAEAEPSKPAWT